MANQSINFYNFIYQSICHSGPTNKVIELISLAYYSISKESKSSVYMSIILEAARKMKMIVTVLEAVKLLKEKRLNLMNR